MLKDIFKLLIEEPEKASKVFLRAMSLGLNAVVAVYLFQLILGPYKLISFSNYEAVVKFFVSGRAFICVLFYIISEFFVIPFIIAMGRIPIWIFSRATFANPEKKEIRFFLKVFGVIEYEDKGFPKPGPNIDILADLTKELDCKESQDELKQLRNSFMSGIWDLYVIFAVTYFFVFRHSFNSSFLNFIVTAILLCFLFYYMALKGMIGYAIRNYREINQGLELIKCEKSLYDTLAEYHIYPQAGKRNTDEFDFENRKYTLVKVYSFKLAYLDQVIAQIGHLTRNKKHVIMITAQRFTERDRDRIKDVPEQITIIPFRDEKELVARLRIELENKICVAT